MNFHLWKKTLKIKPFSTIEEYEEFEKDCCKLPSLEPFINSPLKRSKIKKGIADGIKFDSKWEFAFYFYIKNIENKIILRNKTEFLIYTNSKNKISKFFPDFIINSFQYAEVKGIFRENDFLKMNQCPQVEFYSKNEIKSIIKELNLRFPNWEKEFIKLSS